MRESSVRRLSLLLCLLLHCGCASNAITMAPPSSDRPWVPQTAADGEIIPGQQTVAGGADKFTLPPNPKAAALPEPYKIDRGHAYTLPELINIAQSNNPLTRTAWNNARQIALAEGIAESAFLPRLSAAVVGGYQTGNHSESALGATLNGNDSLKGTVSTVSLQWLLFDFGERAALVESAKQASVISNIGFTAAHQHLIHAVTVAFYAHAAARARATNMEQTLKNAEAIQAAAEDRYKRNIGTVLEAEQAKQATAQARLFNVQAKGAVQDSYLVLISAMGISPLTPIRIADLPSRRLSPAMVRPVEHVVADALARRPDILAAYAAQRASEADIKAAEAAFMPKLFLTSTGAYNSGALNVSTIPGLSAGDQSTVNIANNRLGATVLGGVTFPLYDGGTRDAILKQAQAKADTAGSTLARTRNEAVEQIVRSDNALRTSLAAYAAAGALKSSAQTTFDAALAAYRKGVGTITAADLAQTQLLQANNTASDAYSQALSSAATLALTMGMAGETSPFQP